MAIKLEYCNVIVPVKSIRERLGDDVFENKFAQNTDFQWRDEYLFRAGCMNEWDLADILDEWRSMGFEPLTVIDGEKAWKDVCVVNSWHGPSYRCDWIQYDPKENVAWLKGHPRGAAVGPGRIGKRRDDGT